jgi:hypothetical protein
MVEHAFETCCRWTIGVFVRFQPAPTGWELVVRSTTVYLRSQQVAHRLRAAGANVSW